MCRVPYMLATNNPSLWQGRIVKLPYKPVGGCFPLIQMAGFTSADAGSAHSSIKVKRLGVFNEQHRCVCNQAGLRKRLEEMGRHRFSQRFRLGIVCLEPLNCFCYTLWIDGNTEAMLFVD